MRRMANNLGQEIFEARKGLRRKRSHMGIDTSYLFRIEKGTMKPSQAMLGRIADELGVDAETRDRWFAIAGYDAARRPIAKGGSSAAPFVVQPGSDSPIERIAKSVERSLPWISQDQLGLVRLKLAGIVDDVLDVWKKSNKTDVISRFIASHGPEHNFSMVDVLCQNFSQELKLLSPHEFWLLLSSIWLHDIGMTEIADPEPEQEDTDRFLRDLSNYDSRSVAYIERNYVGLGLSKAENRVLCNMCRFHRNFNSVRDLEIPESGEGMPANRQKLILALLRLASLMAVDQKRVRGLLPFTTLLASDLESDLTRNLCFDRIYRRDRHTLYADLSYSRDADPKMLQGLQHRLQDDLQGALDLVKDALLLYANSVLIWTRVVPGRPPASQELKDQLAHALALINTSHSPNAALVFDTLISSLEGRLARGERDSPDSLFADIRAELDAYLRMRRYQTQISNLADELRDVLDNRQFDPSSKVEETRKILEKYRNDKTEAYKGIQTTAATLLARYREFFLYGYSQSVLQALTGLAEDVRRQSTVTVLECRPKSDHGPDGKVRYCDGVEFARQVEAKGFAEVRIWPDGGIHWTLKNAKDRMKAVCNFWVQRASRRDPECIEHDRHNASRPVGERHQRSCLCVHRKPQNPCERR